MDESVIRDLETFFAAKPMLSLEEVAEVLGVKPKVVYNWTRRADPKRKLPKITVGRVTRLPRASFIQWLGSEWKLKNGV